ncbi:MAG: purine-nucleoside phosphorylase [Planctomycetota bacterium]
MRSRRISRSLTELGFAGARVGVVLGSGLGGLARCLKREREVPFAEVEGMPESSVPGHAGRFVIGTIDGERVLVQAGRVHLYEGWSVRDLCASVGAFAELGCRALVLTNAAGGLRPTWKPPILMRIVDHIDLQGSTPLAPGRGGRGSPYDAILGDAFDRAAEAAGIEIARGVYAGLLGPSYETPAEVRMLAWMGADAVGMSTVREAQAARASGLRVVAVSCITNFAAGLGPDGLSHDEVVRAGASVTEQFGSLLAQAVPRVVRALDER